MLRYLIFFALLAPAASAGVSASTDILPESTSSCEESGDSQWDHTSYEGNGSYYYSSYGYASYRDSCSSSSDLVRANATSNGHDAASVRYGHTSESSSSDDESRRSESWGWLKDNETWAYSYWSHGGSTHRSESRDGQEASISTFAGSAGTFDGCGSTHESGGGHSDSGSSSGNSSDDSYGSTSWGWGESEWGCERTATAETGITSVRAGEESPCRVDSWGFSYEEYRTYNGTTSMRNASYESYGSACANEHFVQVGSERASVGTRNECEGSRYQSYDSDAGEGRAFEHERCETRTGVFGPDGLALYVGDVYGSQSSCAASEDCPVDSYAYRHLGAEHDLVGSFWLGLP